MVLARVDGVRAGLRAACRRAVGLWLLFGCPERRPRGFDGTGATRQRPSIPVRPALLVFDHAERAARTFSKSS